LAKDGQFEEKMLKRAAARMTGAGASGEITQRYPSAKQPQRLVKNVFLVVSSRH
jgi:hypothetical protein